MSAIRATAIGCLLALALGVLSGCGGGTSGPLKTFESLKQVGRGAAATLTVNERRKSCGSPMQSKVRRF